MIVLPIKLITDVDQPIFGANLLNLAKLQRNNVPVLSGLACMPPDFLLQTLMQHFQQGVKEVFDQRLEIVRKKLAGIPIPKELELELGKNKRFLLNGEFFDDPNKLWKAMLFFWLNGVCARLWEEGFTTGIASQLSPLEIFFPEKINNFDRGVAYFDPDLKDTVIKFKGKLKPEMLQLIDNLIFECNKKLYLPQVYSLLVDKDRVFIVKVAPFTQSLPVSKEKDITIPKTEQKKLVRKTVKLVLDLSTGFVVHHDADGVIIEGERSGDVEETIFRLAESALTFQGKPVIYKLPDIIDNEIRGTLRLIHQQSLLKKTVESLLITRQKKNLLNIELAIPMVRSKDEFLQIKRDLASLGVNRKGTLKFWLEMSVPENLINLNDYLEGGLDGVIINLDLMQKNLGGYKVIEGRFYKNQVKSLVKFLKVPLKELHKARVPVLVKGELVVHHEVLDFLIEEGVWGVVVNTALEVDNLPELLHWTEKRIVLKKSTGSIL